MMENRYILQRSQTNLNGWVCTDTEHGIVCVFDDGKFNETQKITILNDITSPDVLKIARLANEMADWLRKNHYDKLF